MLTLQNHIISTLKVKPSINVAREIKERVTFLQEYLLYTGAKGYVIGVSGGQDSALAGKLAQLAVSNLQEEGRDVKLHGILLPSGVQADYDEALSIAQDFIGVDECVAYNIGDNVQAFSDSFEEAFSTPLSDFNKGNMKARMRMLSLYAYAGEHGLLVVGTSNASEELTGFFTKFGDGASDIAPIIELNKRQGKQLLAELDAPEFIFTKAPTADLLDGNPGRTDEDELGVSYEEIDDYLEGQAIDKEVVRKLERLFMKSEHKRMPAPTIYS